MRQAERTRIRRWTRREYERLIAYDVLGEDEPVELLDGLLLVKEPQYSPHRTAVGLAAEALRVAFGAGWFVQVQSPIALDRRSEPEPDVAVIIAALRNYTHAYPSLSVFRLAVSLSALRIRRGPKAWSFVRS